MRRSACAITMEDPRPAGGDASHPVLYLSDSSLPCQVVRATLIEKGVEHRLRHVNLSGLEQVRQHIGRTPLRRHALHSRLFE